MALQENGTVIVWGRSGFGQINNIANCKFIAAGGYSSAAIQTDGTVVIGGYNNYGQAVLPASLGPCKAIALGYQHTVAIQTNGTVVAWGQNEYLQSKIEDEDVLDFSETNPFSSVRAF